MFTLASLACGLAASPVLLIAARVAQGRAAALMFPQALTGIQLHFTGLVRVQAIGRYAIALSAGAVTGQILGGALISANLGSGIVVVSSTPSPASPRSAPPWPAPRADCVGSTWQIGRHHDPVRGTRAGGCCCTPGQW